MRKSVLATIVCLSMPAGSACAADGTTLFLANCSICHQANAQGVPGQFPSLAGRVEKIASTPEGKQYIVAVALNGLMGAITAGGNTYSGFMPSFKMLPDDQIAAILNHVAGLPGETDATIFSVDDIVAGRKKSTTPSAMVEMRRALEAQHPLP